MRLKNSYSAREVAALTGLSARQLQTWDTSRVFLSAIALAADDRRRVHRAPVHAGGRARAAGVGRPAAARVRAGDPAPTDGHAARLLPPPALGHARRCRRSAADDGRPGAVSADASGAHLRPARRSDAAARDRRRIAAPSGDRPGADTKDEIEETGAVLARCSVGERTMRMMKILVPALVLSAGLALVAQSNLPTP